MSLTYIKRFRMEIDLRAWDYRPGPLGAGYRLVPWDASLVGAHADVKYRCFCLELDANVFPCFCTRDGCLRLMTEISQKEGFLPEATWLLACDADRRTEYCGTIQGVREPGQMGSVQNIGITSEHRGRGLGTALINRSLEGFRDAGVERVHLEVTAQNEDAIRLYKRLGFVKARSLYKTVEMVEV
jgi:ribosomal protein S18 acetylase RimI-like enzyme